MSLFAQVRFHLRSLFQKRRIDEQLSDEIRTHVELATEDNIVKGMTPDDARYAALREFGNVASIQEKTRDEHGWVWLEQIVKDIGFTMRSLARARGFSLMMIGILAVGISVAGVVFGITHWILFRAPPFPAPERLALFQSKTKAGVIQSGCFGLQFQAYQQYPNLFTEFAAAEFAQANVLIDSVPRVAAILNVSADFFKTLGIKPVLGRCFLPEEFNDSGSDVVVISNQYWYEKFQASSEVLGRKILINQQTCTVIGVLAVYSCFASGDVYRPLAIKLDPTEPLSPWLTVVGRMNPGVTREQATAALATAKFAGIPTWLEPFLAERQLLLSDPFSLFDARPYWLLFVGGVLLYASACLNAANLMLARQLGRRRELEIRIALGGSRWQTARLVLMDSILLVAVAGLVVLFFGRWLSPPLTAMLSGNNVRVDAVQNGWKAVWSAGLLPVAGLCIIAGITIAGLPMWRLIKSGSKLTIRNGGGWAGENPRMARLRDALVVLQAAFAIVLLVGTGLMVRSFDRIHRLDLGFRPVNVVKVQIIFPRDYQPGDEERLMFFEKISSRLAALPGVRGATYGVGVLLDGEWQGEQLKLPDGTMKSVSGQQVAANFAQVAGLTLSKGRWFAPRGSAQTGVTEAVINETMAREFFGESDPLGQSIPNGKHVIVGVVRDLKGELRAPVGLHYYYPAWVRSQYLSTVMLRLETNPPAEFNGLIQRIIYEIEPRAIVTAVNSIDEAIANSMWSEKFAYSVLKGLTPIAVGLAVFGLFSVITYNVESRGREFGVRLALGATSGNLQRLVLARGVGTAALGVLIGIVGALGLTQFMKSLLFETVPYDPLVYAGVAVLLLFSAVLACWWPARRAAKVDPVISLRSE